ncbi:MAG: GNAT family N-acetyltransferase [Pseudomonadota bacterium]
MATPDPDADANAHDAPMTDDDIRIRYDIRPGDLGRLVSLHGTVYEDEDGHFGSMFEAYVARTVADFVIDDAGRGRVWFAEAGETLLATTALILRGDGSDRCGQLRWIVAAPAARGRGLGGRLVRGAIDYAREAGCARVYLETTPGLDASMALYEKLGFVETDRTTAPLWTGDNIVLTLTKSLA